MSSTRRYPLTLAAAAAAAAAVAAAVTLTACTSGSGSNAPSTPLPGTSTAGARAAVGELTITGGYIPQPASPDVAAAYLTVTNHGSRPDTITKVVTDVTSRVMPMTETNRGGVGSMTNLNRHRSGARIGSPPRDTRT